MIRERIRAHPVLAFVAATYTLTWVLSVPLLLAHGQPSEAASLAKALGFVGGTGPALAGLLVASAVGGDERRKFVSRLFHWSFGLRWWAAALLLVPAAALAGLGVALAVQGKLAWLPARSPSDYLPSVTAFFLCMPLLAFLEEAGWRGFMLPSLQRRYSPLVASIIIGSVHACWHLPLFFIQGTPQAVLAFIPYWVGAIVLAIWLTWLFNHTSSVLAVAVFHTLLDYAGLFPTLRDPMVQAVANGLGLLVALLVVTKDRMTRRSAS